MRPILYACFLGICNNLHEIGYLYNPAERPPCKYMGCRFGILFYSLFKDIHNSFKDIKNRRINGYSKINNGYAKIDLWITLIQHDFWIS